MALVQGHPEVIAIVTMTALSFGLPGRVIPGLRVVPIAILLSGLTIGAPLALQAMGLVLVYRSNRIINFAQASMGFFSGYMFYQLERHREFIYLYGKFGGHIGHNVLYADYGLQVINLLLAVVVSLVLAPLVGFLVYFGIIRLFHNTPPLTVTVATIGVAQLIPTVLGHFRDLNIFPDDNYKLVLPFDVILKIDPGTFHMPEMLGVILVVLIGAALAVFLRFSAVGVILRASADNVTRARTLGVSVGSLTAIVWVIAATLGGVASILAATKAEPAGFDADTLVRVLAVMVIARMTSLPMVVVGAFGLGMIQQTLSWNVASDAIFQGLLLLIITGFLLVQRRTRGRSDTADEGFPAAVEVRPIPPELKNFFVVRRYMVVGGIVIAVLLLGYPWISSPAQADSATVGMIYAMVGLALLVLTGWAGQISLGHFAFAAVGSYVTSILAATYGVPLPIALLAGGLAGAAVAAVVGLPALRLPGLNLAVVTLSLAIATTSILLNPQYLGKPIPFSLDRPGLLGLDTNDVRVFYYLTLVILGLMVVMVLGIRKSRIARALIACRDNEQAAQAFGINLVRARLQAFALSGFIAAVAGGIFAYQQHGVHAPAYSAAISLQQFLITIIGGLGSVWGPLIAQVAYFLLPMLNIPVISELSVPVAALVLLLFFPGGLGRLVFSIRDSILRRIAVRYRISVPSLLADARNDRRKARAPVAPKTRRGGTAVFVPSEYRVGKQWSIPVPPGDKVEAK